MKKILFGILVLSLIFTFSCKKGEENKKLYIYNWTYYIPEEVIIGFEKKFGVKVVYDVFASNEEMFAKLKAGATGYDLTFPSGDYASIMIKEGMADKIEKSLIPNLANIDKDIIAKISFDPNLEYIVPYMMGAGGIAVNSNFIKDFKKDTSVFLRPELKGRITLLDDVREVMGLACKELGFSVNTVDKKELNEAKNLVLEWKKNIQKFDSEAFGKGFAAGEFYAVHGYAENVFLELDEEMKKNVVYFIPEKGAAMYMDSMLILKGAKNKDLAHKFINYIHEPESYAKICDFLMLPCMNIPARQKLSVKPNYTVDDLKNCEFREDLGENLELYNQVWQEIRVGN